MSAYPPSVVVAVDLVEVDVAGAQAPQAVIDLGHDRFAGQSPAVRSRPHRVTRDFLQLTGALWRAASGPEDRSQAMLGLILDGLKGTPARPAGPAGLQEGRPSPVW